MARTIVALALLSGSASALLAPVTQQPSQVVRSALLNAPRKEGSWYDGLSTDPGAAGKVTQAAKDYADTIANSDVQMDDVIAVIDSEFEYTDVGFSVGAVENKAGTNVKSVWKSTSVSGARQFFTKSFRGDDAAVLARSSGEEPASSRHRAGVASRRGGRRNAP